MNASNNGAGKPPFRHSLRARLILLITLALAPAFTLIFWNNYQHLIGQRAETLATAQRIAHSRAIEFAEKIDNTKSLLNILASIPAMQKNPEQPACSEIAATFMRGLPHYANLGIVRLDGTLACSAHPFDRKRPPNFADRHWFRSALTRNSFTHGEYLVGRVTGLHSLVFGQPVLASKDQPTSIAFASIDLAWFPRFVASLTLPPKSAMLVLDQKGRILARHPEIPTWVGKRHPDATNILSVIAARAEGALTFEGIDRVVRLSAFSRIPGTNGELMVIFGLPKAEAEAAARATMARSLVLMAIILLVSFALTWLAAEILILRRARRLTTTAQRLADGDLCARTGIDSPDAIGRLAATFDHMAEAVAQREQYLAQRVAERTAELALASAELAQASHHKSEFLATMSHELRTPLNAIIGFSELLRDGVVGSVSQDQRDYLQDIFGSGTHLLSLINDILDLSKIEAGKMTLAMESLPVEATLYSSLSIVREKATAHHLTLDLQAAPDIGELCADPRKVKQIVYNLLSNAVKFTPDGGRILITAQRVPSSNLPFTPQNDSADYLEIAVADTGIGIAPDDQARLFTAFTQIDSSLARQYQGTGLGLALVKHLALLHGGDVQLESAPNKGSTFRVWLPYRPAYECHTLPRGAVLHTLDRLSARVLVVEDEAHAFALLRQTLTHAGFSVTRAINAQQARERLEAETPDLITLDILLPGEDGWRLLQWLKHNAAFAHIPVVVISIVADAGKGCALGAAAVLEKPFIKDDLVRVLAGLGFGTSTARVLVIDDDRLAVERVALLLEADGHTVERAYDGREGIARARDVAPDLILLDLMMPEVTGFDVVTALRTDSRTISTPIVIVSAKILDDAEHRALQGQVQAVVAKSNFSAELLLTEVRRALGEKPKG